MPITFTSSNSQIIYLGLNESPTYQSPSAEVHNVSMIRGTSPFGTCTITATIPETNNYNSVSRTLSITVHVLLNELDKNSWAAIQYAAQNNLASSIWDVGDWKSLSPEDENDTIAVIIGFNHNSAAEGDNTIHFAVSKWDASVNYNKVAPFYFYASLPYATAHSTCLSDLTLVYGVDENDKISYAYSLESIVKPLINVSTSFESCLKRTTKWYRTPDGSKTKDVWYWIPSRLEISGTNRYSYFLNGNNLGTERWRYNNQSKEFEKISDDTFSQHYIMTRDSLSANYVATDYSGNSVTIGSYYYYNWNNLLGSYQELPGNTPAALIICFAIG